MKKAFSHNQTSIEVYKKETLYQDFFSLFRYHFKHRLFAGGWSRPITRDVIERSEAVALLPYDPATDEVVLIEQIRPGAFQEKTAWQIEIVAGMQEPNESVESVARREALEEAGVNVNKLLDVTTYFPSAGICSEKVTIFVGEVDAKTAQGIHGLPEEEEDIRVHVLPRETAYQHVLSGDIQQGAAIIALQWLMLHHQEVITTWQGAQ